MIFGLLLSVQNISAADPIDITGNSSKTTVEDAIWENLVPHLTATGSGTFDAFLRVQKTGEEMGYNSDLFFNKEKFQFDEVGGNFTESKLLTAVPFVYLNGVPYREFQLDINEVANQSEIIVERFQVWLTDSNLLQGYDFSTYSFPTGANKVYDTNGVRLLLAYNDGSGKREYRVLIPQEKFAGVDGDYVVLFTHHSGTSDGFEEWGVEIPTVMGALQVTKAFNNNGVIGTPSLPTSVDISIQGKTSAESYYIQPFTITVSASSIPAWTATFPNLIPGNYTITVGNEVGATRLEASHSFARLQCGHHAVV